MLIFPNAFKPKRSALRSHVHVCFKRFSKLTSIMCVLKVGTAVWLTTPFYWNMTPRLRVFEPRNFENHSAFVFQGSSYGRASRPFETSRSCYPVKMRHVPEQFPQTAVVFEDSISRLVAMLHAKLKRSSKYLERHPRFPFRN